MELHEKLKELRKQKGMTQEELANQLYVSRTAVSKWESGRGYPNTESLKAMARFFSVSLDSLLSADEALNLAAEENKRREARLRSWVFGLLDISLVLLLFLPLFREAVGEEVLSVSLFALAEVQAYLKILYILGIVGISVFVTHNGELVLDQGMINKVKIVHSITSFRGVLISELLYPIFLDFSRGFSDFLRQYALHCREEKIKIEKIASFAVFCLQNRQSDPIMNIDNHNTNHSKESFYEKSRARNFSGRYG